MTYQEKLKDPRWQKKRLAIFERDNFSCVVCGNSKEQLHIHHLFYKGDPWEVQNHHLITVCGRCHKLEHEAKAEILRDLKEFNKNGILYTQMIVVIKIIKRVCDVDWFQFNQNIHGLDKFLDNE